MRATSDFDMPVSYQAGTFHQIDFIYVPVLTGSSLRPFAAKGP
ncbi:hypothetical protein [Neiella holothuriorum]|nr:hypothetical protein [Neiella holothuriorum]